MADHVPYMCNCLMHIAICTEYIDFSANVQASASVSMKSGQLFAFSCQLAGREIYTLQVLEEFKCQTSFLGLNLNFLSRFMLPFGLDFISAF